MFTIRILFLRRVPAGVAVMEELSDEGVRLLSVHETPYAAARAAAKLNGSLLSGEAYLNEFFPTQEED